jgi:site-specific recombinase XerD
LTVVNFTFIITYENESSQNQSMNDISQLKPAPHLVLVNGLPLDRNPAAVYLSSLAASGRRTQRTALDKVAQLLAGEDATALRCNWGTVRYQHTAAVRTRLVEIYSPATANKTLSALRRVLKEAWKLGYLNAEDYHRAVSVGNVSGETLLAGRELSQGEISALINCCATDPSPAGRRDAALIAILYSCGLRRAEAVRLDFADYKAETGQLMVNGKRNKQRFVYLVEGALAALNDWLALRGFDPGPLFWPITKSGQLLSRRLSTQAVYNILSKWAGKSRVGRFSPHDMRRTFVSDLLDAGADISTVSKLAGHANVQTTARYDRRPEQAKRKAAYLLHIPYSKREPR